MSGRGLKTLWQEIRKEVKISDPEPIGKVLGCKFEVSRAGSKSIIRQDMKEFLTQAVQLFQETPGTLPLRKYNTPSIECDEEELQKPGKLGEHAASLLMKVFYAARCCRVDLMYSISFPFEIYTLLDFGL